LTGKGFRTEALGKADERASLVGQFDGSVHERLFIPQLQGG
jgi:hypothetical protein